MFFIFIPNILLNNNQYHILQEPGDAESICSFTAKKNVKFDIFDKVDINGNDAHPLWKYLKSKQGGLLIE